MFAQSQSPILDVPYQSVENGRNLMIEEISIRNFRGFKHLDIPNLKRVNLLVGKNSSGKSAFMEAIFLSSGSLAPTVVFQMRGLRRMGNQIVLPTDMPAYRGLWEDIFYNFKEDKVSIKITGNPSADSRSLSIEYSDNSGSQELPFGKQPVSSAAPVASQSGAMPQIQFSWKRAHYPAVISKPKFSDKGLQYDTSSVEIFPCIWFTPGAGETPEDNARRFSSLDKVDGIKDVLDILSHEFDFIKGLSIEYHAGIPMVFASVRDSARKMPVPLLSDGVNRLMGICLGIANTKNGTILIDQLEDGFHHKLLPSIWNSIYSLAKQFNVQLFVSTHSEECLKAMKPTLIGHEEDFSLLRASRVEKGCTIDSLPGQYLETALEQDFEVR
jgi:hypothetical protein